MLTSWEIIRVCDDCGAVFTTPIGFGATAYCSTCGSENVRWADEEDVEEEA